ncbi:hypothetical protein RHGRI_011947 [Rhododendron griersonianum]|uniref:Cell number regulator 6 n=1 Tax=Rhododendron griersonianum TaxID=479676 RepID=A0AAV6KQC2_9ERIC|nr:hypothetical protein RHGRI_011947 [Rhododendron griersonianum]
MAGGGDQRLRYVNLTTDELQGPFEEIRPGELNQPIDVPSFPKCDRCRQPLPENFTPLADEPWTTGIFGCAEDPDSCRTGLICPCVLYGRNVERLRDDGTRWIAPCICHAVFCEGGIALAATTAALAFHGIGEALLVLGVGVYACWCGIATFAGTDRHLLQKKYYLEDSPCTAPAVHCCCLHWCALCQEHREMKARLSDGVVAPGTVVDPPPVQEMINGSRDDNGTTPSPGRSVGRNNLELQAL